MIRFPLLAVRVCDPAQKVDQDLTRNVAKWIEIHTTKAEFQHDSDQAGRVGPCVPCPTLSAKNHCRSKEILCKCSVFRHSVDLSTLNMGEALPCNSSVDGKDGEVSTQNLATEESLREPASSADDSQEITREPSAGDPGAPDGDSFREDVLLDDAASDKDDEPITREQRRSRRKRAVRARTISVKRMTRRELDFARRNALDVDYVRPTTRAECATGPRPCPYISCKYHLYLDVSPRTGSIKLNFPDLDVWEMPVSCALDVADAGGSTLEDVGAIMNLTRERIRQLEVKALAKLEALRDMSELREHASVDPDRKRRLPTIDQDSR